MKRILFYILMFFSLCFSACEKDIELDLPDQNQLVILSNFTPDSTFLLRLSTTIPIDTTENTNNPYPENATIELYEDGSYIDDFVFQSSEFPEYMAPAYTLNKRPNPDSEYSIIAKLPGYPDAEAKNEIPSSFVIDDIMFLDTTANKTLFPGAKFYQFDARIKMNIRNLSSGYLHLKAWRNSITYFIDAPGDTVKFYQRERVDLDISKELEHVAPLHEEGELIDVKNINQGEDGIDISMFFPFYPGFELPTALHIEVRHVSEDYYLFHKTVSEQESSNLQESLLSTQSILINSNIENGLGYFGGYSVAVDSVSWK